MAYTALSTLKEKLLNRAGPAERTAGLGTYLKSLAAAVVTLTGTETLTNKTLTEPEIFQGYASHDYGAAAADWTLTAAEAKKKFLIATNASGAVSAVIPTGMNYKEFIVVNTSGQALTIKAPTGTGIVVASTKTATVYFNGTNVVRITADA